MKNAPIPQLPDNPKIPDWLRADERYEPSKDADAFLKRTAAALLRTLAIFRSPKNGDSATSLTAPTKLFSVFVVVFLVATSQNFAFIELVGAALLVRLATFDGRKIAAVLAVPAQAFAISLSILAPAAFWGQPRALVVISCKTLISTTLVSLLSRSTDWNQLTSGLKTFGAPNIFVFTLDLALKYIAISIEICLETLDAVLLRSVGKNRQKSAATGGVVGVAFLKAQKTVEEQFDAMTCRCFSGEYRRFQASRFRLVDLLAVAALAAVVALFVYLESAVR